ncbi:GDSL-type esterase/lipase family protein [Actinotignum urinale]|uniref:GDSL-type esterase/lipase family protein n=1 Tax=Actinotignum urinale TaxID=190146 RepID=UPI000C7FEBF6|nr:GDSL-type esterase/lipase family protein [Actinotignum urinale]WIK59403.1 GDSL-type esterase/lipase family protein [Actinotignum urinale]
MSDMRVIFIGDELVAGLGDARALGWTGRVMARTFTNPPIMPITLAVPGENTAQLSQRWEQEVRLRIDRKADCRLVIGLGSRDAQGGQSMARTRLHLANLLDGAERMKVKTFVVGPPPRLDIPRDVQLRQSESYKDVCHRRGLIYVDTFTPLVDHEQWNTDMEVSGGYTPRQAGYGLMAWLVLHNGWNQWLGIRPAGAE